jgi:uncharacterized protein YbjT (DUF2867 family)
MLGAMIEDGVVVAGATGNIGREVVAQLLAAGHPVRGLVRRADALPEGAEAVVSDLNDPATLGPAFQGARAVFLLSGYDRMAETLGLIKDAGVERVVLLSSSSAPSGDLTNAVAAYHIRSEQLVRESGLAWTFVRPYAFMSNTLRWTSQLRAGDRVRLPFGDVPIAVVDPADVASVVLAGLVTAAHGGQAYTVTGPRAILPAEQVAIVGEALGRPLEFEAIPSAQARQEMLETTPPQYVDAFFRFYDKGELDETTVHPTVQEVTGREPGTFESWVTTHLTALR